MTNEESVINSIQSARDILAQMRTAGDKFTVSIAKLQEAAAGIIAAIVDAGMSVPQSVIDAANVLSAEANETQADLSIINASPDQLDAIVDALMKATPKKLIDK